MKNITTVFGILLVQMIFAYSSTGSEGSARLRGSILKNEDTWSTVSGRASFERRMGIGPHSAEWMPYWSLILQSGVTAYEIAQVANPNRLEPPKTVELKGTVIHSGDAVRVEGRVQKVRKNFGLLSEIGAVRLLPSDSQELSPAEHLGWVCNAEKKEGTQFSLSLWFETRATPPEYWLRVRAYDPSEVRNPDLGYGHLIAWSNHADFTASDQDLVWRFISETSSGRLTIHRKATGDSESTGLLTLSRAISDSGLKIPLDRAIPLTCRVIPGYSGPID